MKSLISMLDLDKNQIEKIFTLADELKDKKLERQGKLAALLFNRPSTRTLVSFAAALEESGIGFIHLDYGFTQLVRGEKLKDAAKALEQYASLVIARLTPHDMLAELSKESKIPIINAGSDVEHPCQALGDLYTLKSLGKLKKGNKIVFIGEPTSNVANSLLIGATKLGLNFTFLSPLNYEPNAKYLTEAKKHAIIEITNDISKALNGANIIYVSPWIKETMEEESTKRMKDFLSYQVNEEMLSKAPKDVVLMHPLPAFRGMEVSEKILDSKNSVIWQQAKNRLYTQKAIVKMMLND
ncbi:MAG: ornithine carbamoyltransferase [Candidatus Micrarchaeota archaeon]